MRVEAAQPIRVKEDWKLVFLLFGAALLPALQRAYPLNNGLPCRAAGTDPGLLIAFFGSAFLLFGLVPLGIIILLFRERPSDYGMALGNARYGVRVLVIIMPLVSLLLLAPASRLEEFRTFYPLLRSPSGWSLQLLQVETGRSLLFYPAWEFFFRGFLLWGLRRRLGDAPAVGIQTIPSCLWHIGFPSGELAGAAVGGLAFGWLALRTESILWPLIGHILIGVLLDLFIVLWPAAGG